MLSESFGIPFHHQQHEEANGKDGRNLNHYQSENNSNATPHDYSSTTSYALSTSSFSSLTDEEQHADNTFPISEQQIEDSIPKILDGMVYRPILFNWSRLAFQFGAMFLIDLHKYIKDVLLNVSIRTNEETLRKDPKSLHEYMQFLQVAVAINTPLPIQKKNQSIEQKQLIQIRGYGNRIFIRQRFIAYLRELWNLIEPSPLMLKPNRSNSVVYQIMKHHHLALEKRAAVQIAIDAFAKAINNIIFCDWVSSSHELIERNFSFAIVVQVQPNQQPEQEDAYSLTEEFSFRSALLHTRGIYNIMKNYLTKQKSKQESLKRRKIPTTTLRRDYLMRLSEKKIVKVCPVEVNSTKIGTDLFMNSILGILQQQQGGILSSSPRINSSSSSSSSRKLKRKGIEEEEEEEEEKEEATTSDTVNNKFCGRTRSSIQRAASDEQRSSNNKLIVSDFAVGILPIQEHNQWNLGAIAADDVGGGERKFQCLESKENQHNICDHDDEDSLNENSIPTDILFLTSRMGNQKNNAKTKK